MERVTQGRVYLNRRMAALVGLGFASGLPNALPQDTLKTWLSDVKVDVERIGLFGLVVFPYVFKFLWAPLLDRYMPPVLGRRRGWLLITQAGVALGLVAMALWGPREAGGAMWLLGFAASLVVFFSASQDIVADAYRADVLDEKNLGRGAAVFVMGYRMAVIAGSAGALFLAKRVGWPQTYFWLAGLMGLGVVVTLWSPEPARNGERPATLEEAVVRPLRQFVERMGWSVLVLAAFVLLFRLPDVMGNAMASPLLVTRLGYDLDQLAWLKQVIGFGLGVVGALVGGAITARWSLLRCLWVFGVLQAASNAGFWLLATVGNNSAPVVSLPVPWSGQPYVLTAGVAWLAGVVSVEAFCGGLVAAGFVAFLMSQCDRRYSAFQYSLLSALMAATGLIFAPLAGYLVKWMGYGSYFAFTIALGLPGMMLLLFMRGEVRVQESAGVEVRPAA